MALANGLAQSSTIFLFNTSQLIETFEDNMAANASTDAPANTPNQGPVEPSENDKKFFATTFKYLPNDLEMDWDQLAAEMGLKNGHIAKVCIIDSYKVHVLRLTNIRSASAKSVVSSASSPRRLPC